MTSNLPRFVPWAFLLLILAPTFALAQCTLSESFDGGFDASWTLTDPNLVTIQQDVLDVDFAGPVEEFHGATLSPCVYTDLRVSLRLRDLDFTRGKAIAVRANEFFEGYTVNLRSAPFNDVVLGKGDFSAVPEILGIAFLPHNTGDWVDLMIEAIGPTIQVYANSALVISYTDPEPDLSGWVFLGINAGGTGTGHAQYDDFWIAELEDAVPTESHSWGAMKGRFR